MTTANLSDEHGERRPIRRAWVRVAAERRWVAVLALCAAWAVAPELFAPHAPDWTGTAGATPHPPASGDPFVAPLGTTRNGAGVSTLIVYSARTTVGVALVAGCVSSVLVTGLAVVAALAPRLDRPVRRTLDVLDGLPTLPTLLVLAAARGATTAILVCGVTLSSWVGDYETIRVETTRWADAHRTRSARVVTLVARVTPVAGACLARTAALAVLARASLAFLGLAGFESHSWGLLVRTAGAGGLRTWWTWLPATVAICLTSVACYRIGTALEPPVTAARTRP